MWVFTKAGFFSAVEKRDAAAKLVVRARSRADIDALADRLKVVSVKSSEGADYPYRLECLKKAWGEYLNESANDIDYDNFKNAMADIFDSKRLEQLHGVWEVMAGLDRRYYNIGGN